MGQKAQPLGQNLPTLEVNYQEAMNDQDQEHAFNHLQGVLQPDGLELSVDEDMQFAVRVKQAGAS